MDLKKFLTSWNGILCILFIGIYLMFPALKGLGAAAGAGPAPEVSQIQLFVGGLAVVWGLKGIWEKLRAKKDE